MVCSPIHAVSGPEPEYRDPGVLPESGFNPPVPRREWVPRQRLVERLSADEARLVAVHAPAGFGKTITVAQWRAAEIPGRAFAWVSLDRGGDDPVRLWWLIVSALQRASPALRRQDLLALLRVPGPDITGRLVPSLVNALAGADERVVLVLDDFHYVKARACHEQVEALLGSMLPPATMVLIGRTVPPLAVARLRAAGEMTEIGMRELAFTPEEAAGLIGAVAGRPLGHRDLASLVERTEGWPAALYLAALSLRSQPEPGAFVQEFTRGNRYVSDYLLEEVIGRQPAPITAFLTRTAILDRFTAELCDAVTDGKDAAEILGTLERENLFLVALDESRRWFRYHHLFRQALRARLASGEPGLVPLLHRRASRWFRAHALPEEAIGHALAAGDTDVAVEVMAGHWYPYVNAGRMETVSGWLTGLDERTLTTNPLAAHTAAWVTALSGRSGTARRLVPVLEASGYGGPLPDGMRSPRSSAALLRATFGFDGIRVMRESAAAAVELEDDPASPWHTLALAVYGFSLYLSGEPGTAQALREAVHSGVADPVIRLTAMSVAALVATAEGRLSEGKALADAALRSASDGLTDTPQAGLARLAVAAERADEGRLEDARRELVRALQARRRLELSPWPTLEIMFRLAAVLHELGDDAGAAALAAEIDGLLTSLPDGAEAQRARLELLTQRLGTVPGAGPVATGQRQGLTDRELTVLRMLRGTMSTAEIAQELGLSANTIKTHIRAVYRKLEVTARPAAVSRGRELGLLLPRTVVPAGGRHHGLRTLWRVRKIAIVGAGQSGTQLALGLLGHGYQVTLVSDRNAGELLAGHVLSSQCMFETALQAERELALNLWDETCPPVNAISFTVAEPGTAGTAGTAVAAGAAGTAGPAGTAGTAGGSGEPPRPGLTWRAALDGPGQSVDQRMKISAWLALFAERGGQLVHATAGVAELEELAATHDLVIIAAGTGTIARLFPRDDSRSVYDKPRRALALTYVHGMTPTPDGPQVSFATAPGIGEYFSFPALTMTGPCDIMCFEGIPGGPMDNWDSVPGPAAHLAESQRILERFFPWEAARCRDVRLTDPGGILRGRITPTVRRPVGVLPSGAAVLGIGDAVVLNDPITGQGANTAAKAASFYLDSILRRERAPFDTEWMTSTFENYWRGWARWVTTWTNSFLEPPAPHLTELAAGAARLPGLAAVLANGFDDPRTFFPWWFDAAEAKRLIAAHAAAAKAGDAFDPRALRRALGQYATGVTIVTCQGPDGEPVGMTANSFTSVSLDPPLVLWCPAKSATSTPAFSAASHFAVNVLGADQHHLSRQFATPADDKFLAVPVRPGASGAPLLEGTVAAFECRTVAVHDGGDHLIMLGEVERFDAPGGAPLVFHSGLYHLATRHPDI